MKKKLSEHPDSKELAYSLWFISNEIYEALVQAEIDTEDINVVHKTAKYLADKKIMPIKKYIKCCSCFRKLYDWQNPPKPRPKPIGGAPFVPLSHEERMASYELQFRKLQVMELRRMGKSEKIIQKYLQERENYKPILHINWIWEFSEIQEWYGDEHKNSA